MRAWKPQLYFRYCATLPRPYEAHLVHTCSSSVLVVATSSTTGISRIGATYGCAQRQHKNTGGFYLRSTL